jgi:hypothetical protein
MIRHSADFYLLSPHRNKLHPKKGTNIQGLYLAGVMLSSLSSQQWKEVLLQEITPHGNLTVLITAIFLHKFYAAINQHKGRKS